MSDLDQPNYPSKFTTVLRGFCGRCPQCGQGALFQSYLKPNPRCSSCAADFSDIRADDGPTWLTIIITGHLAVPVAIYLAMDTSLSKGWALSILLFATIGIALLLLPRAKGIFINMLWLLHKTRHLAVNKYENAA